MNIGITVGSEWAYLIGLLVFGVVGYVITSGFFKVFGKKRYYLSDNAVLDIQAKILANVATDLYDENHKQPRWSDKDVHDELMAQSKALTDRKTIKGQRS
jgi:hypothetical protein